MTITFAETLGKHHVEIPADLIASAEVPVITGPQRQGDVGIFPRPALGQAEKAGLTEVAPGSEGVIVVRGESAGGNAHILDAYQGPIFWSPATTSDPGSVLLGILHVPEGSVAILTHTEEHGSNGIGAGTYRVTGKRTQADVIERVRD